MSRAACLFLAKSPKWGKKDWNVRVPGGFRLWKLLFSVFVFYLAAKWTFSESLTWDCLLDRMLTDPDWWSTQSLASFLPLNHTDFFKTKVWKETTSLLPADSTNASNYAPCVFMLTSLLDVSEAISVSISVFFIIKYILNLCSNQLCSHDILK